MKLSKHILPKKKPKKKIKCKWCGNLFFKEYNRQEYCSDECSDYARLECTAKRVDKYRKKYDKTTSDWIGCGYLGEHKAESEEIEKELIRKEFKRLKLKRY